MEKEYYNNVDEMFKSILKPIKKIIKPLGNSYDSFVETSREQIKGILNGKEDGAVFMEAFLFNKGYKIKEKIGSNSFLVEGKEGKLSKIKTLILLTDLRYDETEKKWINQPTTPIDITEDFDYLMVYTPLSGEIKTLKKSAVKDLNEINVDRISSIDGHLSKLHEGLLI